MFLMCPNPGFITAQGGHFDPDPTHFLGHSRIWHSKVNFQVIKDNEAFLSGGEAPGDILVID
jgi:hypothetical protein